MARCTTEVGNESGQQAVFIRFVTALVAMKWANRVLFDNPTQVSHGNGGNSSLSKSCNKNGTISTVEVCVVYNLRGIESFKDVRKGLKLLKA